jgi:zinc transporter ZupT
MENLILPFTLTLIAGMSTGIGTIIAITQKRISNTFFATSLGFSAGIMVFISLTEMYPTASETFNKLSLDNAHTVFYTTIFFLLKNRATEPKTPVIFCVCPLGNEYPVASALAASTIVNFGSFIQGRSILKLSFKN